jgi:hypothetical protein
MKNLEAYLKKRGELIFASFVVSASTVGWTIVSFLFLVLLTKTQGEIGKFFSIQPIVEMMVEATTLAVCSSLSALTITFSSIVAVPIDNYIKGV